MSIAHWCVDRVHRRGGTLPFLTSRAIAVSFIQDRERIFRMVSLAPHGDVTAGERRENVEDERDD